MENRKVIVVGAGIGGLSTGYWLRQLGYEVEILEASNRPGGRVVTIERRGDRIDVGAQAFISNYRYGQELISAVGLDGCKRKLTGKVIYALEDGSTCIYDNRTPYMKVLGLRGNLHLYKFLLKHIIFGKRLPKYDISGDVSEHDSVNVMDFFGAASQKGLRDYVVTPMSMIENLGRPEWLSLAHFIFMFQMMLFDNFFALTCGNGTLTDKLADLLSVQYEAPVRRVVMEKGRAVGVEMENDGSVKKAGHVVVAVDPLSAGRLMPEELEEQRAFFDSILASPTPIPVFFLDRPLRKDVWVYSNDPRLDRTFMAAWDEHAKIPEASPSGKATVIGWSGHPKTGELMKKADEEIIKEAKEDIELMIPGFGGYIEEARVYRHTSGSGRFPPGAYKQVIDFKKKAEQLKGISFVSDVFGGCYMEAAMTSAKAAVGRVRQWGGTA